MCESETFSTLQGLAIPSSRLVVSWIRSQAGNPRNRGKDAKDDATNTDHVQHQFPSSPVIAAGERTSFLCGERIVIGVLISVFDQL